ncbi:MAG TPA: hypothetical protein VGZ00_08575 [Candidatus Baltobacteraceae bacterium]|nr:hypothetical protein [Candidatus Baltobacteraceae bacterium]
MTERRNLPVDSRSRPRTIWIYPRCSENVGGFLFFREACSIRIAILIDGSNLVGALGRGELGYPALAPLVAKLRGEDTLALARFYKAPTHNEP